MTTRTNDVIGIDVGSVTVKAVRLDPAGRRVASAVRPHIGRPAPTAVEIIREFGRGAGLVLTGSGVDVLAEVFGAPVINEVVAHGTAAVELHPGVRSVIEMGGEDSKFISIGEGRIEDFSMNALCAAGTGSFLDQQAERLGLDIDTFADMALRSKEPPRIAGRCSVFAKSDMIHLQQIATPVEDVVAGLCFAVARNFGSAICQGRRPEPPVLFQGGVALNAGMVRAFREVLGLREIIVPERPAEMGAYGAALYALGGTAAGRIPRVYVEDSALERLLSEHVYVAGSSEPALLSPRAAGGDHPVRNPGTLPLIAVRNGGVVPVTLGIDIGSISTNLALVDRDGNLVAKRYLMTAGRPIDAVRRGLREIHDEVGERVLVERVGTTGSGRYMIGDFVGADVVKNEITAQAVASAFIDPEVESIFEIGGQDSKYIALKNGAVVDFEMNKACAAGTGSFLEEQAERLHLNVKKDFAERAFCSARPCSLGERCTVFMENSLRAHQQQGAPVDDLLAGLAYSIVRNYLNRVVGDREIGKKVFFQGGTAFNTAVVAAFERVLGRKIVVPPHHDVTGAIGMALIARRVFENNPEQGTAFKGFDLWKRDYSVRSFHCKGCSNVCEINKVNIDGEETSLFYGGRCEKYDRSAKTTSGIPDLVAEREEELLRAHQEQRDRRTGPFRARIGIPRIFFGQELLPLWSTFLWELGFEVLVSPPTSVEVIRDGIGHVLAEACFPVKVAHGHIREFLERTSVDAVWVPSVVNLNQARDDFSRSVACPHTQTIPYVSRAALGAYPALAPIWDKERGRGGLVDELHRVVQAFGVSRRAVKAALKRGEQAQAEFGNRLRQRGSEVLGELEGRAVVLVGRPYNALDGAMNLGIHRKLNELGVPAIPMDFLPVDRDVSGEEYGNMYWCSGRRILRAADIIRDDPRLHAVFITNFSCGPDSFILRFFKERMGGAPFLQLEIDEHSADAGAVTRCEAFLDSLENVDPSVRNAPRPLRSRNGAGCRGTKRRTVFIPPMCDHSSTLAAAFEACGVDAEVLPPSTRRSTELGRRFVSGKECYPCAVTTGDMAAKVGEAGFDPERSAFLMPSGSGPCRFGQYNVLHRLILDELGYPDVPIMSPVQEASFYDDLAEMGDGFARRAFDGIVAVDLLTKCLHETRPYERNPGETDEVYGAWLRRVNDAVRGANGAMPGVLAEARREFEAIPRDSALPRRPRIGVVGEIFVRSNRFSNEDLVRAIENLGGEVWLAPIAEWIFYINRMGLRQSRKRRRWRQAMRLMLEHRVQERVERSFSRQFEGLLETLHEPSIRDILKSASCYLHDSFEGEAILSIGKAVDLICRGSAGVISAMPFGCMPGTIVSALFKSVKKDYGAPTLSLAFDGTPSSSSRLQLEAFMHQAREYHARRETSTDVRPVPRG